MDDLERQLKEIADAGAKAAARHLAPELHAIAEAYNKGEINLADARLQASQLIEASGARLNFILSTQKRMAESVGMLSAQTPGQIERYPAWRLARRGWRNKERTDWDDRWRAAGSATGWQGACKTDYVALKSSPIWAALGEGAGGFRDAIGNPFPPFAFGSGMDWKRVSRDEAQTLGLV